MIRKMFNLRCSAGHNHYSPTPQSWVGKSCMKALDAVPGHNAKKCDAPMAVITKP